MSDLFGNHIVGFPTRLLIFLLSTAQVQKLKHSVSKGDKKKKKEITEQIAKLEADLDAKHEQDLKALKEDQTEVHHSKNW